MAGDLVHELDLSYEFMLRSTDPHTDDSLDIEADHGAAPLELLPREFVAAPRPPTGQEPARRQRVLGMIGSEVPDGRPLAGRPSPVTGSVRDLPLREETPP